MKKYIFQILGAVFIIVLIIAVFKVTSKKVSESPFETQAVETAASETQPEIVVHNEGEDKVNIDDLDVSVDKPVYETVGTTEIVETDSDGVEITETIGVVETEAYGGYIGVKDNGSVVAGFNCIPLSSGHQYTEVELTYVDLLINQYVNDESLGEDFIDNYLSLGAFNGLSAEDKEEIKSKLLNDYPHSGSGNTSETLSETTETELETTETELETEVYTDYESDNTSETNENISGEETYSNVEVYVPTGENITYGENWFMEENPTYTDEEIAALRELGINID